jgi:hypothetical protein
MRPPAQYVALHDIQGQDTYAFAARTGDDVTEAQRVNLGLVVGVDISPLSPDAMQRPADDAPRSEWQNYAVVRGVPYSEAVDLDTAELRNRLETRDDDPDSDARSVNAGTRPAAGDKKDRWVDYAAIQIVQRTGGRVSTETAQARAAEMTKAELAEAFGEDGAGGPDELYADPSDTTPDGTVQGE